MCPALAGELHRFVAGNDGSGVAPCGRRGHAPSGIDLRSERAVEVSKPGMKKTRKLVSTVQAPLIQRKDRHMMEITRDEKILVSPVQSAGVNFRQANGWSLLITPPFSQNPRLFYPLSDPKDCYPARTFFSSSSVLN
jgi:hypothetical protein